MSVVRRVKEDIRVCGGIGNVVYIVVRGRVWRGAPASIVDNQPPPTLSRKHHFSQKHQINFCIDDYYRAASYRQGDNTSAQLKLNNYGTVSCKPEENSGV